MSWTAWLIAYLYVAGAFGACVTAFILREYGVPPTAARSAINILLWPLSLPVCVVLAVIDMVRGK